MLDQIDVLVYDVQDIGSRYYTFVWTMVLAMRACAKAGKAFVVLDRPNPLGGAQLEGGAIEPGFESFVGLVSCPNRHGLTAGEIARWRHAVEQLDLDLAVIAMRGWQRDMRFEHTGLPWVMPSPNMPTIDTALVYPGMCLVEGTELSEGRGTTRPFELVGRAVPRRPPPRDRARERWSCRGCGSGRSCTRPPSRSTPASRAAGSSSTSRTRRRSGRIARASRSSRRVTTRTPRRSRGASRRTSSSTRFPRSICSPGSRALREGIERGASLDELAARWPRDEGAFAEERG